MFCGIPLLEELLEDEPPLEVLAGAELVCDEEGLLDELDLDEPPPQPATASAAPTISATRGTADLRIRMFIGLEFLPVVGSLPSPHKTPDALEPFRALVSAYEPRS